MNIHRYTLEPYKGMKSRYTCPGCGKHKTFTRYIDTETGNHISEDVGKCNREVNCSYHYKPKQYFEAHRPLVQNTTKYHNFIHYKKEVKPLETLKEKPVSFIQAELFKQSLKQYNENNFVQFLTTYFGSEITSKLISRYFIGTSKHWNGATVFWQIDMKGKIRTGKIMLYNTGTGKRIKEPYNHINWVHSALKLPEFHLQQCFFGEHLLQAEPGKPVAVVESEKTAITASIYLPQFVWLAVGSLTNLTAERCKVLQGKKVVLFPDLKAFDKWKSKAKELSHIAHFTISDLLEKKAPEADKQAGYDIADYLLKFPVQAFQIEPKEGLPPGGLQIYTNDIISMLGETHTGKDFNKLIIAGIKTKSGKVYDLLFDESGELIRPGEHPEAVNKLAGFFEKKLMPAMFDNTHCWIHTDNRFIVNNN